MGTLMGTFQSIPLSKLVCVCRMRVSQREKEFTKGILIKMISEQQLTSLATLSPFPTNQTAAIHVH